MLILSLLVENPDLEPVKSVWVNFYHDSLLTKESISNTTAESDRIRITYTGEVLDVVDSIGTSIIARSGYLLEDGSRM